MLKIFLRQISINLSFFINKSIKLNEKHNLIEKFVLKKILQINKTIQDY